MYGLSVDLFLVPLIMIIKEYLIASSAQIEMFLNLYAKLCITRLFIYALKLMYVIRIDFCGTPKH